MKMNITETQMQNAFIESNFKILIMISSKSTRKFKEYKELSNILEDFNTNKGW